MNNFIIHTNNKFLYLEKEIVKMKNTKVEISEKDTKTILSKFQHNEIVIYKKTNEKGNFIRVNKKLSPIEKEINTLFCNKCGGELVEINKNIIRQNISTIRTRLLTCKACNNEMTDKEAITKEQTKNIKAQLSNIKQKCSECGKINTMKMQIIKSTILPFKIIINCNHCGTKITADDAKIGNK